MRILIALSILLWSTLPTQAADPKTKTENVIFVMVDGVRWQEVFSGADESLLTKERGGVADVPGLKKRFWRPTPTERREALMPFLWGTVAKEGQLFGNQFAKSVGRVTNGKNFSYPGYNEVLCGFPDDKVDSNDKNYNRNVTVLEWLNRKPDFKGKIAAFTSWDVFPYIINDQRSGILVNAGQMPLKGVEETDAVRLLNRLTAESTWPGEDTRPDALTFHAAKTYLKEKKPRVMYLSFDETDTHGHAGRYDRVLGSAYKADSYIRELWETIQAMPEYKGKTTLIITTDHGRGDPPVDWKSHSAKIAGSEYIWIGMLGPDTPALGERKNLDPVGQNQIAATLAAVLGLDYCADVPKAGTPLPGVIGRK